METMGYESKVEGMSALKEAMRHERPEKTPHYHFCADTIMISYCMSRNCGHQCVTQLAIVIQKF